eukprot:jgi/Bigna1/85735/estExt_fgenesh1_pg.C_50384
MFKPPLHAVLPLSISHTNIYYHKFIQEEARLQINAMVLRKHFYQLTQLFLMPFDQYFEFETEGNLHLGPEWNPYFALPYLPPFKEQAFLKGVRKHVDHFPMKGLLKMQRRARIVQLYRRFLKSPNFIPWFNNQRDIGKVRLRQHMRSRLVGLRGELFLRLVCHVSIRSTKMIRTRAQRFLDTVVARPTLDVELKEAIEDHLRTLDSLLPPPKKAPHPPKNQS